MRENRSKDAWDKLGTIAALLASVLVPMVVAFVGYAYTSALKESENRVKYTELAISILQSTPSPESQNIRGWAVGVINRYSGVAIDSATRHEFASGGLAKIEDYVATEWVPAFADNFLAEIRKNRQWQAALASCNSAEIEKYVEELVVAASRSALERRRDLARQMEGLSPRK